MMTEKEEGERKITFLQSASWILFLSFGHWGSDRWQDDSPRYAIYDPLSLSTPSLPLRQQLGHMLGPRRAAPQQEEKIIDTPKLWHVMRADIKARKAVKDRWNNVYDGDHLFHAHDTTTQQPLTREDLKNDEDDNREEKMNKNRKNVINIANEKSNFDSGSALPRVSGNVAIKSIKENKQYTKA